MSLFGSETELLDTRTPQQKARDKYFSSLVTGPTPEIPTEEIAGMSEAEQMAQELVKGYGASTPEGLATLRGIATGPTDITQDPTIQALIANITKAGDLTTNRVARSLMLRGATGGAGRDVLGRSVTETQQQLMSTLAPYAESAKARQMSAAELLNQLGEQSTLNRLNALSTTGALPRTLKQLQNTANYQKLMTQVMFPYTQKVQASGAIGNQPMSVMQTPSLLSQAAPLVRQLGAAAITGGMSTLASGALSSMGGGFTGAMQPYNANYG